MAKICPNCGKQNKITAKFCEDCGTSLNEVPDTLKQNNIQKNVQSSKFANIFDQIKNFWKGQNTKGKAVTGVAVCCLGVIIFGVIGGALFPDKSVSIRFNNATYDSPGVYHVDIDNSTTEYVIYGYTESGSNLTVSSTDLNISTQRVNLTSDNTFTYKVKIPKNVTSAKVRFEAIKSGKENTSSELTIKRVISQVSTSTPVQTSTSNQYNFPEYIVGNSKFQLPGEWKQTWNANGESISRSRYEKDNLIVNMAQYNDKEMYNLDYKKSSSYGQKTVISGIKVMYIKSSQSYNSDPTQYPVYIYYFPKNNKYYCLSIEDINSNQNVNEIANTVITTLH